MWQRARKPEQRQERVAAILEAAAALLPGCSIAEITISAIAAAAGLAKGSLYGYFATKEEVLLALLRRELAAWFQAVDAALPGVQMDARKVALLLCDCLARRPLLLRLLPRLFIDIEGNLSLTVAASFKAELLQQVATTGALLERALPRLAKGSGGRFLLQFSALIAGLWPMAHPTGSIVEVLAQPEMAALRVDFFEELPRVAGALLCGLETVSEASLDEKRSSES